jgi:serine/threonine protein kinase/predicted ATPase
MASSNSVNDPDPDESSIPDDTNALMSPVLLEEDSPDLREATRHDGPDKSTDDTLIGVRADDDAGATGCETVSEAQPERLARASPEDKAAVRGQAKTNRLGVGGRFGRYRIDKLLGRGGMGEVYLAHDLQLDRDVAIKIPYFPERDADEAVSRFLREARAMATLHHSGLCPVYDVGELDGQHYLSMAFIDGSTLANHLSVAEYSERQVAELLQKIAIALHSAHEKGIVHRDLKPSNVMITTAGEPVIMDFGLARRYQLGETGLTQSGVILGTPAYMSPEQAESRLNEIDARTDVWALGVILYVALSGRLPFEGSGAYVLGQIVTIDPAPLSNHKKDVSPLLDAIVKQAMSKQIAGRQASAREFAEQLGQYLRSAGETTLVPRTSSAEQGASGSSRRSSITSKREGELRNVTIAAFSLDDPQLAADPELQADAFATFREIVRQHVEQAGGVLLPGEYVQLNACFGFPIAYEDSVVRAVRAAVSLLKELGSDSLPDRIAGASSEAAIAVVIHSGEAIGWLDPLDNSVVLSGDVRGTAQRLDAVAESGSVVVSGAAHERARVYFRWEPLGSRRIRGIAQPLEMFRVIGEVSVRSRVDLVDPGNLTPLIGRNTELTVLKDRWEQTIDELGQVVVLIGDAGLGKSRLIREIRNYVIEHEEPTTIVELRCAAHHGDTSFFPVIDYMQRLFQFDETTEPAARQALIEQSLHDTGTHSAVNLQLLAELLSVPLTGSAGQPLPPLALPAMKLLDLTQSLLLKWLHGLARKQSVLFIVEDLHWADASTLGMLTLHVTGWSAGRMMTLLTFRPEFKTPWTSSPHQTQIALNRLPKRQIAKMIQERTRRDDISDQLLNQLIDRTDGIPLFIEEFCNLLVESGMLDADLAPQSSFDSLLAIPATLQDLMIARLDRMDCNPDVIQLAAVIGREFSYALLAAACILPEQQLQGELQKLIRSEVLFQHGELPDAQLIFKHALIQDAAYNSLLKKKRQAFHSTIATTLESRFPDTTLTQPALLAHHFTEAGNAPKAVEYWQKAGQQSQARSASQEAVSNYKRGLDVIATMPESATRDGMELGFQVPLGVSLLAARGYACPEAGPVLARSRELGDLVADPVTRFFILWGTWAWRVVRSDLQMSTQLAADLIQLATQLDDPSWMCEAHFCVECDHFYHGRFAEACRHAEAAILLFNVERCRQHVAGTGQDVRAGVLAFHGNSLWPLGYPDQAVARARETVELFSKEGHPMTLAFGTHHATWVLMYARKWREALELAERAKQYAAEQGFTLWVSSSETHAGICQIHLGQLQDGLKRATAGVENFLATGANLGVPRYLTEIAAGHLEAGNFDEAQSYLDRAFRLADDCDEKHCLAETHRIQGELLLARDPQAIDVADTELLKSIEVARLQKACSWELRTAMSRVRLHRGTERAAEAVSALRTIRSTFTEGFDTADLTDADILLSSPG